MKKDFRFFDILIEDKKFDKHPLNIELNDFLEGSLAQNERQKIEEHLVECKRCRDVLVNVIENQKKDVKKKVPANNLKYFFSFLAVAAMAIFIVNIDALFEKIDITNDTKSAKSTEDVIIPALKNRDKIIARIRKDSNFSHSILDEIQKYKNSGDIENAIKASHKAINDIFFNKKLDSKLRLEQYILILDNLVKLEKKFNQTKEAERQNNILNKEIEIYNNEHGEEK